MSARSWSVAHSRDGNWVELYEYDRRTRLWAFVTDHICFCRMPNLAWRVPVGWPRWDDSDADDRYMTNSVASLLYGFENRLYARAERHFKRCRVGRAPISDELCVELVPSWAFFFEDDDDT